MELLAMISIPETIRKHDNPSTHGYYEAYKELSVHYIDTPVFQLSSSK